MISDEGNINTLLQSVTGGSFADVVERITAEKRAAEATAKRSTEPLRRQMFDYTQSCRELKWWLTTKTKPRGCEIFPLFQPLTRSLVERGELPASMLDVFR